MSAPPEMPAASSDRVGPPDTPAVFAPPAETWRRVSPKLTTVRRIARTVTLAVIAVALAVPTWLIWQQWWIPAVAVAVVFVWWLWLWVRAGRVVRAIGYAERDADLCVTGGLWFKELLVVPFGRMQVVKVSSGPLLRAHGLATVELVTASAQTDATIPGLPMDEARILRDRLIQLSDAKGSGL
ncbi:MAG: PH domain-containing protein [Propionibacteriaceae bacterium]|nr:PH domain-containing protein [Propionibacteriaceae bacterium]